MSKVTLFKAITTEEALQEIESNASSYEGLYVEMSDPEQRKLVKTKAGEITDIIKKVDRARIDFAKAHKTGLDKEAKEITSRLEAAATPFTDLLDEWKLERQKILDHKKAQEEAKQKEIDHEDAIMHNKIYDMEKREAEAKLAAEIEAKRLADIAEAQRLAAEQAEIAKAKAAQDLIDAENKRLADLEQARIDNENRIIEEKRRAKEAEEKRIKAEQQAAQDLIDAQAKAKQDAIDAENRRLADIERAKQEQIEKQKTEERRLAEEQAQREANQAHVVSICKAAKESLMLQAGLTEEQAIIVVKAVRSNLIQNVSINI